MAKAPPRRPPARRAAAPRPLARLAALFPGRWVAIGAIVLGLLVLLPVVAAILGEVWALLLGALLGGFALGRATAR